MLQPKKGMLALFIPLLFLAAVGCSEAKPVASATMTAATITPQKTVFNANIKASDYRDIVVTLDSGSFALKKITWASDPAEQKEQPAEKAFFEGADYKKDGNTITFLKESLKENMPREGGTVYFVFEMSGGNNPVLTLSLAPDESGFDLEWYLNSLIPKGATRTEEADNRIRLTSKQSVSELIAFYQTAAAKANMVPAKTDPSIKANWSYAGIRDSFKFGVYLTRGKSGTVIDITFHSTDPE